MRFEMTIAGIAAFLAQGGTVEQVVRETYRRIAECPDPAIWISLRPQEDVLAAARELDRSASPRRPLHGVPFAIKDNIDLAGLQTTAACPDFAYEPQHDAPVVARLRSEGALAIGKTNMDQFAMGLVGTRSPYGAPHCVFNRDYISGGSSSGSAVAVARGLAAFSLGTDTAGSGRVPAAFNNIVGMKPTLGALSSRGVTPACRSLDCVSIFAVSCEEAMKILEIASAYDDDDPFSRVARPRRLSEVPKVGVVPPDQQEFYADEAMKACYRRALDRAAELGWETVEIDFSPFAEAARALYGGPRVAERLAALETSLTAFADRFDPAVREIAESGRSYSAADAFRAGYELADLKRRAEREWRKVDVLMLPTTPSIYRIADVMADPIRLNARLGHYTNFVNLLDCAAVAVPAGFSPLGLPFGVSIVGPAWSDADLARYADQLHRHLSPNYGLHLTALPKTAPKPGDGQVLLAVVGAHLRDQPLHWQLADRNARFVGRACTNAHYRLYALDTAPPKPGLVRDPDFIGGGIEVEIFSLDFEAFGSFVAEVPPPLAIGNVSLEDGSNVKGFVCESAALSNACEITGYGGWRAYLSDRPATRAQASA